MEFCVFVRHVQLLPLAMRAVLKSDECILVALIRLVERQIFKTSELVHQPLLAEGEDNCPSLKLGATFAGVGSSYKYSKSAIVRPYYAVHVGRHVGIYTSWAACERKVIGYSGPLVQEF